MKKRIVATLLAFCLVLGLLPGTARAATVPTSGTCGENLTWNLSWGTLTIAGTGSMEDYFVTYSPWWLHNLTYQITSVLIGNGGYLHWKWGILWLW